MDFRAALRDALFVSSSKALLVSQSDSQALRLLLFDLASKEVVLETLAFSGLASQEAFLAPQERICP